MTGQRQAQKERTRARILSEACRLFTERGFEAVTLADILAAAGVTKGGFYHHFADKKAVFRAAFVAVSAGIERRLSARAAGAADPRLALTLAFDGFFDIICAEPGLHRLIYRDGLMVLGWSDWIAVSRSHCLDTSERAIHALAAAGRLRSRHPDLLGTMLMAASDYLADDILGENGVRPQALDAARAAMREMIELYCAPA
ncbi:TetR family transcriptional regulator [Tistrella bauzanensis]|uniref:TetR family transcriptional regulator n=1 Tax=Tistrella bauzanensis TaxID=657419 RepID=A0ABQ1ID98_9PROT|nr:TetR/AcrR family transcriptional regulator [Tistrella bauzanensis]GGB35733.1 TetR family transcriptional regulator [Tistrella bauzanensis]